MPVIEITNLSYTYLESTPLASPALHGISLKVDIGEIIALMGETGSGKSTLLQFCNGLLRPARPGVVHVLGTDTAIEGEALRRLRLRVGLLMQRAEAQLLERFVGDDVAFGPRQAGLPYAEVRERVRWAMEAVGLGFERFKDRRTFNLSGGEMKKVALAGLLAAKPELLLLDEPTAGLDPESKRGLLALIKSLRDSGTTIVIASTDVEDLPGIVDRLLVLYRGHLAGEVVAADISRSGEFLRAHALDLPETGLVLEQLRQHGIDPETPSLEPDVLGEEICKSLLTFAT